jgi:segregation and condensation protein B
MGHYNPAKIIQENYRTGRPYLMISANEIESDSLSMTAMLEAVLFAASGPLSIGRLAKVLETSVAVIENLLESLEKDYENRGIRIQWSSNAVQLTTVPEASHAVERLLGLELTTRFSQAALEVVSIIAFMQPITRPQIDRIRGVNSDSSLRTLLSQGLIEEVGRLEGPGRPILYGTTPEFLQHFGLNSIDELPPMASDEEE